MKSSELSQTTESSGKTGPFDIVSGTTGAITRVISRRRYHRRQWRVFECVAVIILDCLLLCLVFWAAWYLRYRILANNAVINTIHNILFSSPENASFTKTGFEGFILLGIGTVIGMLIIFAMRRLYNLRLTGTWFRQVWVIFTSTTISMVILITYLFFYPPQNNQPNSRLLVPFIWAGTIIVLSLARLIVSGAVGILYRLGLGETRLLVVGSGRLGKMVMQHITANPSLGYSIVGFLHDMSEPPGDFGRFKMLGTLDDIGLVIRSMQIDEVLIALPAQMHQYAIRSVKMCERLGASFKLIPDLYELSLSRIDMEAIEGIPLIGIKQTSLNSVPLFITRLIDIAVSSAILLLGSPIWLCIAFIVKISSPGPVIFAQTRVGKNGKEFKILKFRSMYKDADQRLSALLAQNEAQGPLFKMKNDPRITPIGGFVRRTSLDEIPQLINVLRGDMSLVGPRPAVPREVAVYEEWHRGRLAIRPGLTGLWQVRGRSDLSFDEGVLMDLYYIENWSLRLYIQILMNTVPAVLFSRGAY